MNRQGTVTGIQGRFVTVSTQPLACCSGGDGACHCLQTGKHVAFQAVNEADLDLEIGDQVDVRNSEAKSLWAAFRLLALPAGGLFAGVAAWRLIFTGSDPVWGWGIGLTGLALGFLAALFLVRSGEADFPVVAAVIRGYDLKTPQL